MSDPNQQPPLNPRPDEPPVEVSAAATHDGAWPEHVSTVELTPPGRPRRVRRSAIIAAGAALLVLVASGTAVARLWFASTGALPEQAMPASTAAFLRINLTPGYGQRVKVLALLNKFPAPKTGGTTGTGALDTYKTSLLKDFGLGLSLDDVKGWFDDRAGVGVWPDSHGRPVILAALATNDDSAARKTLGAARDRVGSEHLGFVVSGGYALLTKSDKGAQAAADEAARAATKADLARDPHFRTAVAALPTDEAVLAYADLAQVGKLAAAALGTGTGQPSLDPKSPSPTSPSPTSPSPRSSGPTPSGQDKLTGYLVSGAQAVDDGIEIRGRSMGVTLPGGGPRDARADLGASPGNTALGAVTGGLGDTTAGLGQLDGLLGAGDLTTPNTIFPGLTFGFPGVAIGSDTGTGPDSATADPTDPGGPLLTPGSDGKFHIVGPDGKKIVIDPNDPSTFPTGNAFGDPTGGDFSGPVDGGAGAQALQDASKALLSALGAATSIHLTVADTPVKGQDPPATAVTVQLADDAVAKKFTDDLTKLTGTGVVLPPGVLTVAQHGSSVEVQTRGYAKSGGTLADNALFKEAMAGAPSAPSTAVYLDIHKLATVGGASADTLRQLGPIKAVGLTAGHVGNDGVILARIVIQ